jgi:hypothetical protein
METNAVAIKARCLVAEAMRLINYGENLSFGWPKRSGKEAVDGWYCEINIYDFNNPFVTGRFILVVTTIPTRSPGISLKSSGGNQRSWAAHGTRAASAATQGRSGLASTILQAILMRASQEFLIQTSPDRLKESLAATLLRRDMT